MIVSSRGANAICPSPCSSAQAAGKYGWLVLLAFHTSTTRPVLGSSARKQLVADEAAIVSSSMPLAVMIGWDAGSASAQPVCEYLLGHEKELLNSDGGGSGGVRGEPVSEEADSWYLHGVLGPLVQ